MFSEQMFTEHARKTCTQNILCKILIHVTAELYIKGPPPSNNQMHDGAAKKSETIIIYAAQRAC